MTGPETINTSPVELTFTGSVRTIRIQSDNTNSHLVDIYIGKSDITNLGGNAMARLKPGDTFELDYDPSSNSLYVVASIAAQKIYVIGLI